MNKTSKRSHSLATAVIVPALLAAAGCTNSPPAPPEDNDSGGAAGEWDAVLEEARAEGQGVLTATDVQPWIDAVGAAFSAETGLSFGATPRGAAGIVLERLSAEVEAGAVSNDVFMVADQSVWIQNPDWFVDLDTLGLPNLESYPEDRIWKNKCVEVSMVVGGILYNSDLVPEDKVPHEWEDLLDPFWKGRLALTDPAVSPTYNGWAFLMDRDFGEDYLQGIAAQEPDVFDSATPAAQQVAAGVYLGSVLSHITNSSDLRAQGAPLEFVIPDKPNVGHAACAGVMAGAPHPQAAKVLLNFLMSAEAQSAGCDAGVENASPLPGTSCYELPEGQELTPVDPDTGYLLGWDDEDGKERIYGLLGLTG